MTQLGRIEAAVLMILALLRKLNPDSIVARLDAIEAAINGPGPPGTGDFNPQSATTE